MMIAVAAIILAASLGYTFIVGENNRKSYDNLNAEVQSINSNVTFLQGKLTILNSSLIQLSKNLNDLNLTFQQATVKPGTNASSTITYISNSNVSAIQKDIADIRTVVLGLRST
jgi:outer membrane murein-binding lipoprotein Lpp